MMKTLALVALLALLSVPAALAQPAPDGLTLSASSAGTVAYAGSGSFPVSVSVGCLTLVAAGGEAVTVTVVDPPAWFNATDAEVEVSPQDCDPATGQSVGDGTLAFTVSASAPAVAAQVITLRATLGTDTSDATAPLTVAYNSDYSLTPSVSFPLAVANESTTFTVTGVQASNAMSMIMVDDFSASCGSVSGIGALQYNNQAGKPDTKTYTVTYKAPAEDWQTCTLTLKVYGHYNFDGNAGDPTDRKTITWEVTNGGVPKSKDGGSKDSPAPVGALTALGLLGLAAVLRRKA